MSNLITIQDGITGKVCTSADCGWKPLTEFLKHTKHVTGRRTKCKVCTNKYKIQCIYPDGCPHWAVHSFDFCKKHGGGKKCDFVDDEGITCTSPCRPPFTKCVKHGGKRLCQIALPNGTICNGIIGDGFKVCRAHGGYHTCTYVQDGTKCQNQALYDHLCFEHRPDKDCVKCNRKHKSAGTLCYRCRSSGKLITIMKKIRSQMMYSDKKAKNENRRDAIYEASLNYLLNMFEIQEGNCYYCHVEMSLEMGNHSLQQISIDRIHSSIGHFPENVVLSCIMCNHAKAGLPFEDWSNLMHILQSPSYTFEITSTSLDRTLISKVLGTFRTAVHKNQEVRNDESVDLNFVYDLLRKQDWKCKLTGLPLQLGRTYYFPFFPSLDRIDNNKKGHTKDNCHLVCRFANFGRNRWSVEEYKVAYELRGFLKAENIKILFTEGHKYPSRH